MIWANPYAFLLLIVILLLILKTIFFGKTKPYMVFSNLKALKNLNIHFFSYMQHLPLILKLLAMVFMILALARPQSVNSKIKKNAEGIDIMIALDTSDSMLIEDMKPENRLGASKQTIRNFVSARISDRIGLVVFSGESYTRVPLTLDYPLLFQSLEAVETTSNLKMGTAIGVALANAVARLKDSTAKSRVVILLTDGENNSGTIAPETALDIAKGYDIKIYTIGVGRDGMAKLPVYTKDIFGRKVKTYQPMHSKVNESLLTRLANETGGKYYRATNSMSLKSVFEEIDRLEKTKVETTHYTNYEELYQNFLIWGLVLYILSVFLGRTWLRRNP